MEDTKIIAGASEDGRGVQTDSKSYEIPVITVLIQPEDKIKEIPRHLAKNVIRLLQTLGIPKYTAIVARRGELLTPDRAIYAGDHILVRKVTSVG